MKTGLTYEKLPPGFYRRPDVLMVAKELLGKILVTRWNRALTSGRIIEVEAYEGVVDRASHAHGGRRTARNEVMYGEGGIAYVYLCYGIHHLFNVVSNITDVPHAVLVRAIEPLEGIDTMLFRTGKIEPGPGLGRGPGNLTRALGISTAHSGMSLQDPRLFIATDDFKYDEGEVGSSPRIGVDYAGTHAQWPYRFFVKGHRGVSGPPKNNR